MCGCVPAEVLIRPCSTANPADICVAAAVRVTAGVMHTVAAAGKEPKCQLGPVIFTTIEVNGVPAKTLVDTGSPATIISLEFVLDVFAKNRSPQQTAAQWQVETQKRFSEPNITLSTYGGQRLDILAETHLRLSQGGQTVEAPVLVQKDAPNPLLLGTDLQFRLGFALVMISPQARVDLLSGSPMVQVGGCLRNQTNQLVSLVSFINRSPIHRLGPGVEWFKWGR